MTGDTPPQTLHSHSRAHANPIATAPPPRLMTLILLSALAVLPVNMILPSLPKIAAAFDADFALLNLSVTGFALITALIEVAGGAIADRFGRRRIVLISLSIFILASIGCALAPNIGLFLLFRALQACISPCYSVALVIVKESSSEREAVSKFGYLAMGWAIAPMVGPMFGGSLDELFGWQASFIALAALGAAALVLSMHKFKRGVAPPPRSAEHYLAAYRQLLGASRFWAYTLCMACSMGVLYVFLGGAPLVIGDRLGGSSAMLGFYMGLVPTGFIIGSYLAGRYASKRALSSTLIFARLATCVGLLAGLVLWRLGVTHVLAFFGPCMFIGIGNGLTMPAANSGALSVRPDLAGTAAGLSAAVRLGGGALVASLASLVIGEASTIGALFATMLIAGLLALASAVFAVIIDRRSAAAIPQ